MYRTPARPNECAICDNPATTHCPRCGRPLCAACSPRPNKRCYHCERAFVSQTRRCSPLVDLAVLTPFCVVILLLGFVTGTNELFQLSTNLIIAVALMVGGSVSWFVVRNGSRRERFLAQQIATEQASAGRRPAG